MSSIRSVHGILMKLVMQSLVKDRAKFVPPNDCYDFKIMVVGDKLVNRGLYSIEE